jgi:hypothetical protein
MTSDDKAGATGSDISFLDGLRVPAVETSRSHTPPERDITSKLTAIDCSDVDNLQGLISLGLFLWNAFESSFFYF